MSNHSKAPQQGDSLWVGYLIIAVALFGVSAGAYLLYTQWKTPAAPRGSTDGSSTGGANKSEPGKPSAASSYVPATEGSAFPLHNGSSGDEVKSFQHYLNTNYSAGLVEDGIWGSKTTAAASKFLKITSVSQAEYDSEVAALSDASTASTIAGDFNSILPSSISSSIPKF